MKTRLLTALTMLCASLSAAWADGIHYQYENGPDQHIIYVSLTDAKDDFMTQNNGLTEGTYYLGAFIDGECRGEAEVQFYNEYQESLQTGNLFALRVEGNSSKDTNKKITFRLCQQSYVSADYVEYRFPETVSVLFQKDFTTGEPSDPHIMKFVPATGISLPGQIFVNIGDQVDMMQHITVSPEGSLLPYPLVWSYPDSYVTIGDNVLDAVGVTTSAPVTLTAGNLNAMTEVVVRNPAHSFVWDEKYVTPDPTDPTKAKVTVDVNDPFALLTIFDTPAYIMTGDPAAPNDGVTTTFTWTSYNKDNQDVVAISETDGLPTLQGSVGTAVITGTPDDDSGITPQLTVEVVQPVWGFLFDDAWLSDIVLVAEVGENINTRLKQKVTAFPLEATDPSFTATGSSDEYFDLIGDELIAKKANSDGSQIKINSIEQYITITANDGFMASETLKVVIIPKQPEQFDKTKSIYMVTPEQLPADITDELFNNLKLLPEETNIDDFRKQIILQSNNESIISQSDGKYLLNGSGDVTITASIDVKNVNDVIMEKGVVSINMKTLTESFDVHIQEGLTEFTADAVRTTTGEEVELTLTPQPEGVDYDPDKISVTIEPAIEMPDGWTFATVTKKEGDKPGLQWTINTNSVGNALINIYYQKGADQELMGTVSMNVDQQLSLSNGWQWISLYQGQILGKDSMKIYFGENLSEIRSSSANVYNDPVYSYFGGINYLDTLQTYKICMKNLGADTSYNILESADISTYFLNNADGSPTAGPAGPLSILTRKGWNWIGNPYQYYQKLTDIFGNTQFSEGDEIRSKEAFAQYTNGAWAGALTHLTPGQGYLFYVANAGQIDFEREFNLSQQTSVPNAARSMNDNSPWTIADHSRFADNMSMIAHVGGLDDVENITLYAFRGNECRGRGVAVGDRQFITVHGEKGERYTFRAVNNLTGEIYELSGSRAFAANSGTYAAPVPLYADGTTTIEAIQNESALSSEVYDLQGRRVNANTGNAQLCKGIYVQSGRKVVK
jgi:hypothetical protein